MKFFLLLLLLCPSFFAQVEFEEYFENKTLRFDYFHSGNKETEYYSFDELIEEPFWGGKKKNLIEPFELGRYKFMLFDLESGKLLYTKSYSTLFNEWQTTVEAEETFRTFSETVTMPFPREKVKAEFYSRNRENKPVKKFEYIIDPDDYFIRKERKGIYETFTVQQYGDPDSNVDIVIVPEGYTSEEMDKFEKDCSRFAGYLFGSSPFRENREKFNIYGVKAPSIQSGADIPAEDHWVNTAVDSRFWFFDLERYIMTSDNKTLRNIAANVPYDQIYILVNSSTYGGGSIYNLYSVCTSDNRFSDFVFVHEFGHGFASLADEYYTSDVAYNEFYPTDVEPLDPNVTTLVEFEKKWKEMIEPGTPIPTPATDQYKEKVGVYEGGGYVAKGVFRPMQNCTMNSISTDNFCPVCRRAIEQMIDFYTR
ncbi:MAG: IgA Peptidase M64 [Ignavibacteriaceae bacterium]